MSILCTDSHVIWHWHHIKWYNAPSPPWVSLHHICQNNSHLDWRSEKKMKSKSLLSQSQCSNCWLNLDLSIFEDSSPVFKVFGLQMISWHRWNEWVSYVHVLYKPGSQIANNSYLIITSKWSLWPGTMNMLMEILWRDKSSRINYMLQQTQIYTDRF